MKNVFTLFAAVALMATASFAQNAKFVPQTRTEMNNPIVGVPYVQTNVNAKTPGDTVSIFPWTESFDLTTTPAGFTLIDGDGDGYGWDLSYWNVNGGTISSNYAHSGDGMIASASYINNVGVLTPDNWMILPTFEIPSNAAEYNISWYEADYSYAETYVVYICTTGRDTVNFSATTPVATFTTNGQEVVFVKRTIDLSSYAGQTINIAFRHYNVSDNYWLFIDDMRVGGAEPPIVSVSGPETVRLSTPATFVAAGASTYTWEIDGIAESETGDTLVYTFNSTGIHTVVVSASNTAGTAYDTLYVDVYSCDNITTFPHTWTFENEMDANCLTLVDGDNDGNDWYYLTSAGAGYGHNSDGLMTSASWASNVALTPDNWMILPGIELPANAEYFLSWYAKAQDAGYPDEYYSVYIATAGSDTTDFVATTAVYTGLPTGEWGKHSVALSSYAGQTIYVAFRHYNCTDMFRLNIDDVRVGELEAPDVSVSGPVDVVVGEAYEWTAISDVTPLVWTVNGDTLTETGDTLTYTFSTAGEYYIEVSATNAAGTTSDGIDVNAIQCDPHALPYAPDLANDINLCWENDGWGTLYDSTSNTAYIYSMSNLYGYFELDPDNWIYTPYISMPAEGSYEIAWQVMPYTTQLPSDHYGVYVVKDGNETLLFSETLNANMTELRQRAVTIPETITGDFKVAFRHYETTGGYVILVTDIKVVTAGSTPVNNSIDDANASNIAVYPSPATSMLRVEGEGLQQVEVIDVNGRVVISTNATSINVSTLAEGVYMVRVVTNDGVSTQKIVKK